MPNGRVAIGMPTYAECMRHDKNDLIMLGKYRLFWPVALLCTAEDQRTKSGNDNSM
jgi:hypothetical protein